MTVRKPLIAAATPATWLCRPDKTPNPCTQPLTASVVPASGAASTVTPKTSTREVDCFYVYPTVSGQPTGNANLAIEPAQRGVARSQVSRYSPLCKVWAPMYRQVTLAGIGGRAVGNANLAYTDARAAWREYLERNGGKRGVVLVGHSQGTFMLRRLLREEITPKAATRRLIVSAHLIGGDAQAGELTSFGACKRSTQTGCVVAYSTYDGAVSPTSLFGRSQIRFFGDANEPRRGLATICVNPAALGGGSAPLRPYFLTAGAAQPWVGYPGRYTATCVVEAGATVLKVKLDGGGASDPRPRIPSAEGTAFGLHAFDSNLALGDLVALAEKQSAVYTKRSQK